MKQQTTQATCSMQCGACKRTAAHRLNAGGKTHDALDFGAMTLRKVRARRRVLFSCDRASHVAALQRCADMYGGKVSGV